MTAVVKTLGRMRDAAEPAGLVARLGSGLNSLFDHWPLRRQIEMCVRRGKWPGAHLTDTQRGGTARSTRPRA